MNNIKVIEILTKYQSPIEEASFAKGIPMKYLKLIQGSILYADGMQGVKGLRYVFRGPSKPGFKRPQAWIPKAHATSFAIYERGVNTWLK